MGRHHSNSVILADRNMATSEGVRGLLEAEFDSVYVVADLPSLDEGASRLAPSVIVIDPSFRPVALRDIISTVKNSSPRSLMVILTLNDQPEVARTILAAGAHAAVLKRQVGTELFAALDAIGQGGLYASPDFGVTAPECGNHQVS